MALLLGNLVANAELPTARLSQVRPAGGQAGTSFEVSVTGSDLDDPVRLHFSRQGITATPKGDGNRFTVTIESNTPPGVCDVRFLGRFGLSNPHAFVVGLAPEIRLDPTNTTAAAAAMLPLDMTVNSWAQPNAVAHYKFSARKGQRLLIECVARAIDSRLDPTLIVTDSGGRELERSRNGPPIDFIAPADGTYLLKLSDFLYRGGDLYFYRLTASTGPHVDFILPPAGWPGTKTNCTVYGRNLPGGKTVKGQTMDGKPLEQLTVEIQFPGGDRARRLRTGLPVHPFQAAMDGFEYRLKTAKGTSNPFLMSFATAPVVLEQEPNNKPGQAQKLRLPCEVAGQFHPAGEQDWYTFEAKKGEVYWIDVFSQRLGLPTDPSVLVQRVTKREKGTEEASDVLELSDLDANVGDREFDTAGRDVGGRLEVKEDGTYRVLVRDLSQRTEHSPRFVYRLSIRPASPDFRLAALSIIPKAKADAKNIELGVPFLRRGETIAVRVMAFRQHGFNSDIQLSLDQPPPGLIFRGGRVEAGKDSDVILLSAAEDAPAYAGPIRLLGKAKVGDRELVSEVRQGTLVFPVGSTENERAEARLAREFALAISDKESAPVIITPTETKHWEVSARGKLQVPLRIQRQAEFTGNLKLKPIGPGASDGLKEFEIDSKATNATLTLDFAALKLSPGPYVFAVQTQASGKYRNDPEGASFAEAAAKEAGKVAEELNEAAKKAAADLEAATKAAQEAEMAARSAQDKLAAAQAALDKLSTDPALQEKRDEAARSADQAGAKAKAAAGTKTAAEQNKATAETKANDAKARKEAAANRAQEATNRAKPRDVTLLVHSASIPVTVTPEAQAKSK